MGLFSPAPKITPDEWKRIRTRLDERGLSTRNLDDVEAVIHQALREKGRSWGMDKKEAREAIAYLREKRGSHNLSERDIDMVAQAFDEEL